MSLNRRRFLQGFGAALCTGLLPESSLASDGVMQLPVPPLIEARNGRPVFLSMQGASWSFERNKTAFAWGFNGRYLGPTVRVYNGDNVKLSCSNKLFENIALAISGLQAPGTIVNGSARLMRPESSWSPVLPIRQSPCTCWYHAATPKQMAHQVYNGLAGMWIIDDLNDAANKLLPKQYGIDDFPIILQDKVFGFSGSPEYKPPYREGFLGDTLLTNGVHEPSVEVGKTWIRLRLLNASNARRYTLSLSNDGMMYLVASDQGLLATPVILRSLSLAPGERKEILINMSQVNEVSLVTGYHRGFADRVRGLFEPSHELPATKVLTLKGVGFAPAIHTPLPDQLRVNAAINYTAQQSRQIVLNRHGKINGLEWNPNRIDLRAAINSQERWLVSAEVAQAFHIQGAEFQVVSVGNKVPLPEDAGWKDTVWVDEPVELLVRFNSIAPEHFPFMYYSQNLELADLGAMGQFTVG